MSLFRETPLQQPPGPDAAAALAAPLPASGRPTIPEKERASTPRSARCPRAQQANDAALDARLPREAHSACPTTATTCYNQVGGSVVGGDVDLRPDRYVLSSVLRSRADRDDRDRLDA